MEVVSHDKPMLFCVLSFDFGGMVISRFCLVSRHLFSNSHQLIEMKSALSGSQYCVDYTKPFATL